MSPGFMLCYSHLGIFNKFWTKGPQFFFTGPCKLYDCVPDPKSVLPSWASVILIVCLVLLLFYDSSNLFGCLSSVFKMKRLKMLLVFLCTQTRALLCLKSAQSRSHPLLQGFKASSWDIQFLHGTNI